jgi:hypothetical protein
MPRLPSIRGAGGPGIQVEPLPWHLGTPHGFTAPALPRRDCRNFPPARATAHILSHPSVISAVIPSVGFCSEAAFSAARADQAALRCVRHGTCFVSSRCRDRSQTRAGSVNSDGRSAKTVAGDRGGSWWRCGADRTGSVRQRGWNHGAAGYGYRKRTRVRVACGGAIRPRGVGILLSHGHFGRLVVGRFLSPVVPKPTREGSLRRGHPSRGPGLPAAALTTSPVGFVRMSASADRAARATRPSSAVVTRAAPVPAPSVGMSGGWRERTRPGSRMRLRRA